MPSWTTLSGWLHFTVAAILIIVVVLRKREAASVLAWCLVIALLPFVGTLLYLMFGTTRVPRRLLRRMAHADAHPPAAPSTDTPAPPLPLAPGAVAERLGAAPAREGNDVRVFEDGGDAFDEMLAAVAAATHHVHVQFFIFRRDALGERLLDALKAKARAGVEVRVLVDGVGTLGGWRLLREVRRAGGRADVFLPLVRQGRLISPSLRNHRKLVVCDGRVAYAGGLNVGNEYLGARAGRRPWYDLHVGIAGPAVWDLQDVFAGDWSFCTGQRIRGEPYYPPLEARGTTRVRVVAGGPDVVPNPIREALFAAFARARSRIVVATPYLVPDTGMLDALCHAARSGVEVSVVMQSEPADHPVVQLAGMHYAGALLEAGGSVLLYSPGMMHAKAIAVDGDFGMIGTANLDRRSLELNFELMLLLEREEDAAPVREALERLVGTATPLTLDELRAASAPRKLAIALARLFSPIL